MPNPWLLLAVVLAWLASLFVVGSWQNTAGAESERLVWQQGQMAAERLARSKEQAIINQLEAARNEAVIREQENRRAAASAAAADSRLRGTISDLRRSLAGATAETVRITADAGLSLFGECTAEYRALAEIADRHASDVKTLTDAWPTQEGAYQ